MSEVQEFELLARFLAQSRVAVAFTGAGISTECGIPDFRSKNSAWARNPPMPLKDFLASEANQIESWRRKFAMDDLRRDVKPGRGHRALARLFECGPLTGIITQNIDGLHQAAGVADTEVVELHGNGGHALCVACGVRLELSRVRADFEASGRAPRCECGGVVKSGTISFGQAMPRDAMARARHGAQLRFDDRYRFVAGGLSGGRLSIARKTGGRAAGDSQPRPHAFRPPGRPRSSRRHRNNPRALDRGVILFKAIHSFFTNSLGAPRANGNLPVMKRESQMSRASGRRKWRTFVGIGLRLARSKVRFWGRESGQQGSIGIGYRSGRRADFGG